MVALQNKVYTTVDNTTGRLVTHNELMETLVGLIRADGRSFYAISQAAHVSPSTIDNWVDGKVLCPRMDTTVRVAMALGYRVELVPDHSYQKH